MLFSLMTGWRVCKKSNNEGITFLRKLDKYYELLNFLQGWFRSWAKFWFKLTISQEYILLKHTNINLMVELLGNCSNCINAQLQKIMHHFAKRLFLASKLSLWVLESTSQKMHNISERKNINIKNNKIFLLYG